MKMTRRTFVKGLAAAGAVGFMPSFLVATPAPELPRKPERPVLRKVYRFPLQENIRASEVGIFNGMGGRRTYVELPEPVTVLAGEEMVVSYEVYADSLRSGELRSRAFLAVGDELVAEASSISAVA